MRLLMPQRNAPARAYIPGFCVFLCLGRHPHVEVHQRVPGKWKVYVARFHSLSPLKKSSLGETLTSVFQILSCNVLCLSEPKLAEAIAAQT